MPIELNWITIILGDILSTM